MKKLTLALMLALAFGIVATAALAVTAPTAHACDDDDCEDE